MPTGVEYPACATYNNKIYVFGGETAATGDVNLTQIYDIASDSWTTGVPSPFTIGERQRQF